MGYIKSHRFTASRSTASHWARRCCCGCPPAAEQRRGGNPVAGPTPFPRFPKENHHEPQAHPAPPAGPDGRCSQTRPRPAPAATTWPRPRADQQTLAHLDAQRLQSQHWLLQQATGADGKRIDALFAREQAGHPGLRRWPTVGQQHLQPHGRRLHPGRRQADGQPMASTMMAYRQGADGAGRSRVEPPAGAS